MHGDERESDHYYLTRDRRVETNQQDAPVSTQRRVTTEAHDNFDYSESRSEFSHQRLTGAKTDKLKPFFSMDKAIERESNFDKAAHAASNLNMKLHQSTQPDEKEENAHYLILKVQHSDE